MTVRILVADDNDDHRFFITRILEELDGIDLDVASVADGEEVLDYLRQVGEYAGRPRPHLVLLDLRMPRMDGLEVLAHLRSDPDLRRIPVCVLTSSDRHEDVNATYERGGNSYVVKRPDLSGLREELREVSDYWTTIATLPVPP